jgi:serine/threonine-protein kinase
VPPFDLTGRTLDDFHVLRRLGEGGMGQVYLAEQVSLKRNVALKILRSDLAADPASLKRFKAEAEAVAKATHANIVQIYAFSQADGLWYIALEFVEGRNLAEYLSKKGPPELALALSILLQTAAALARAGELGIIHRDIKPENILLTRKGEVKVTDFGLSRVLAGDLQPLNLTQSGYTMGTPLYMSPEQVEGKPLDVRTDIYSLGVTAYHLLSGQPPFRGVTAFEVALQHVRDEPQPLKESRPDLPPALCAVVQKMMAKDPGQRYATARDLLRDLGAMRDSLSASVAGAIQPNFSVELAAAPAVIPSVPAPAPSRRNSWLPVTVGASLLIAAGVGGALALSGRRETPLPPPATGAPLEPKIEDVPALNSESALKQIVEEYLRPPVPADKVPAGLGLCLELSMRYLDQHRLDDADQLFERLDKSQEVKPYHYLGHVGRGITAALRDQPDESNRYFKDVFEQSPGKPVDRKRFEDARPQLWRNPRLRFWLAEAVDSNLHNNPQLKMPQLLIEMAKPAGKS